MKTLLAETSLKELIRTVGFKVCIVVFKLLTNKISLIKHKHCI